MFRYDKMSRKGVEHMPKSTICFSYKKLLLIIFVAVLFITVIALSIGRRSNILHSFDPGAVESIVLRLKTLGWAGLAALLVLQVLQVVIAFLPGGGIELAGGIVYGAVAAILISILGIIIGTAIVSYLCRRFGKPFVVRIISPKAYARYSNLIESKRLKILTLVLFFLPGVPKDILTYVVGLSGKLTKEYFAQMMFARIPSIAASAIAGNAAANGDYKTFFIIYCTLGTIGLIGILVHNKIVSK